MSTIIVFFNTKSAVRQGRKTTGFDEAAGLPTRVTWLFMKCKQAEYEILMKELEELCSEVAAFKTAGEGE